jgi:hypothetical protein
MCASLLWVRRGDTRWRAVIVAEVAVAAVGLDLFTQALDLWDVVLAAFSLVVGALLAQASSTTLARAAVACGIAVVTAEGMGRVALAPAPGLYDDPPAVPWFRNQPRLGEATCAMLSPRVPDPLPAADGRPAVLHVGDSLLSFPPEDPALESTNRLPGLVGARDPDRQHVPMSMPGAGYDAYLLAVRAALARREVQEVLLYVYPGNDLSELGRQYPCCPAATLIDLSAPDLATRCEPWTPPPPDGVATLRLRSRAPVAVRWLSGASVVFGNLRYTALSLAQFNTPWTTELGAADDALSSHDAERALEVTATVWGRLATELRDRDVALTVVILPTSAALQAPDLEVGRGIRARVARIRQIADEIDVPVIDASTPFPTPGLPREMFAEDQVHFSDAGHRFMAAWLAARLDGSGQRSVSSTSSAAAPITSRATP